MSRRDHFTSELIEKLDKKFIEEYNTEVYQFYEPVLTKLRKERYLDDAKYFRHCVLWKTTDGYGPYYIKHWLYNKGYSCSIDDIKKVLSDESLETKSLLEGVIKKYLRTNCGKDKGAIMRRSINYLTRRGFESTEYMNILKKEVDYDESDFFEGC